LARICQRWRALRQYGALPALIEGRGCKIAYNADRRLGISNCHLFWRRQVQQYLDPAVARPLLGQFKDDPGANAGSRRGACGSDARHYERAASDDQDAARA
jgi:hypothetical protein